MKTIECFECDLSKCKDCKYWIEDGYACSTICGVTVKRSNEAWNYYHPDNLMPEKGFVVHHKNENRLDDSEINIKKWTRGEHQRGHMKGKQYFLGHKHAEESKKKTSVSMKGKQNALGYKHSDETKEKNRRARIGNQNALGCKHPPRTEEYRANVRLRNLKYWEEVKSGERTRKKRKIKNG